MAGKPVPHAHFTRDVEEEEEPEQKQQGVPEDGARFRENEGWRLESSGDRGASAFQDGKLKYDFTKGRALGDLFMDDNFGGPPITEKL